MCSQPTEWEMKNDIGRAHGRRRSKGKPAVRVAGPDDPIFSEPEMMFSPGSLREARVDTEASVYRVRTS